MRERYSLCVLIYMICSLTPCALYDLMPSSPRVRSSMFTGRCSHPSSTIYMSNYCQEEFSSVSTQLHQASRTRRTGALTMTGDTLISCRRQRGHACVKLQASLLLTAIRGRWATNLRLTEHG